MSCGPASPGTTGSIPAIQQARRAMANQQASSVTIDARLTPFSLRLQATISEAAWKSCRETRLSFSP